uniref:Uncharacterized protein n=1 Tax=Oryza meridionalis TaxID=40149 RepID=A0A0E0F1E4_9ORYZ
MSHTSFGGLVAFLKLYFPYLTDRPPGQALPPPRLLQPPPRHHLPQTQTQPLLLPDGGNVKAALRIAAVQADHPAPDDLAGIMTAQYPSHLLTPIIRNLQRSNHLLTTHDVRAIKDLLDTCQWPPPNTHFLCCQQC